MSTNKIHFIAGDGKPGRGFYAVDPSGNLVSFVPGKFKDGGSAADIKPGWHWASQSEIDASIAKAKALEAKSIAAKGK